MVRDDPAPHSMRVPFFVSVMISQQVGWGAGRSFHLARAAVKRMKQDAAIVQVWGAKRERHAAAKSAKAS
jgi:hypothetical protein